MIKELRHKGREILSQIPGSGYDPLSRHRRVFNIITTAKCNGGCNDCHTARWMRERADYDLSMDELRALTYWTRASGYKYELLSLSGGDPSLWSNLIPGVKHLRKSNLFKKICAVTNGIEWHNFEPVIDYLDYISVSQYNGNEKETSEFKAKYPDKVNLINQTIRHIPPTTPIPDSLPARCHCRGWSITGSKVWACNCAETLITMLGFSIDEYCAFFSPLRRNYLEKLEHSNFYKMRICQYCIGNDKVYTKTPVVPCATIKRR
jgi:organic radical activating enzyme